MIRRLLFGLLVTAALGPLSGCAYYNTMYHADKAYDDAIKEVEQARQSGQTRSTPGLNKFNLCIEKCEKMLEVHGGSKWADDAHFLMGKAYYGKGDYLSARRQFQRFRGRYPNSDLLPKVLFWSGLNDLALGEPDAARKTWNELLEKYPKYDGREEVEFHLAEVLREEDRYPEAAAAYTTFLEAHPKDKRSTEARLNLGSVLMEEGDYEAAAVAFEEVANRGHGERDRLQARLALGDVYERQQRYEEALAIYTDLEYEFDPSFLDGRMTPEEREAIRAAEQEMLAQARADSAFNATFENSEEAARTGRSDPNSPNYDPNYDPNRTTDPNDPFANTGFNTGSNTNSNNGTDPNDPFAQNTNPNDPFAQQQNPNTTTTTNPNPNLQNQQGQSLQQQMAQMGRVALPRTDPHFEDLARVIIREGRARAAMGKPWEAILAFEQVLAEYPNTEFAAEAQYRIAYTYEVDLEDYAEAEKAYLAVAGQGRTSSFAADADNRARNLKTLKAVSAADTTGAATAADVDARFVRAELYLYQQDKPEKAIEEYLALQKEFAGSEIAAKAALAEAYLRFHVQADTARGRAKYAEVMTRYPDTQYGHFARRLLQGPEKEPKPEEFVGPSLALLLSEANLEALAAENEMVARLNAPPDTADTAAAGVPGGDLGAPGALAAGGAAALGLAALGGDGGGGGIDPLRIPAEGPSPILTDAERAGGTRKRFETGFMPTAPRNDGALLDESKAQAYIDSLVAARDSLRVAAPDTVAAPPPDSTRARPRGPRAGPPRRSTPPPAPADTTGSHGGGH